MRFFIYNRKSTESEDRQVQSLDDQSKAMGRTGEEIGATVVEEYSESRSAKAPHTRPLFAEMLKRLEGGEAEGILCWNLNRLFRNGVDYGQIDWLLKRGVLKCVRTPDREYGPEDSLLMAIEAGMASQFVVDLRKAVMRGMQSKAEKGWFPGKAPPGYRNNLLTCEIEVDEHQFGLYQRAWRSLLSESYTVPQLREVLVSWGLPKMARSNIYKVFSNPFYYGWFRFAGGLYPGKHTAMISKDEFDRVQEIIHRPAQVKPQKHEFAFTGLMRCGVCGCRITAEKRVKTYATTGNTRIYIYYHCTGSKGCSTAGVREEYVETTIQETLNRCRIDESFTELLESVVTRHCHGDGPDEAAIATEQSRTIHTAHRRSDRLLELRLAGEIDAEEFKSERNRTQNEIAELEAARKRLAERHTRTQHTLRNVARFASHAYKDFERGSLRTKRGIARALSRNYLLTLGQLSIEPHPLLERIRTFEPPSSPSHKVGNGTIPPQNPQMCSLIDDIRKLITDSDLSFEYETKEG